MSQGAKPALQKRSQKTRDKLLNSLENLLKKKSFEEISISEIAKGAKVSPASIYRRFENKEAFIPVLFEIYLKRIEDWSKSPEARVNIQDISGLKEVLKAASLIAWTQLTKQAHLMKAIYIYAHLRPGLMGPEWKGWEEKSLMSFRAIIEHYKDEVKRQDLEKAGSMVALFFNIIFIDYGLFGAKGPKWGLELSGEQFANEVADMAYGYLVTPEG